MLTILLPLRRVRHEGIGLYRLKGHKEQDRQHTSLPSHVKNEDGMIIDKPKSAKHRILHTSIIWRNDCGGAERVSIQNSKCAFLGRVLTGKLRRQKSTNMFFNSCCVGWLCEISSQARLLSHPQNIKIRPQF
jgi:hypothetical protein